MASLGLALALVLTACGEDTTSDSTILAPIPIRVARTGSGSVGSGDSALAATANASPGSDRASMIAPWVIYDFTVGAGFPALPTQASGWQYHPTAAPDFDQIARIAAALGVSGDPVARPAEQGGGWILGPDDGSAPALWISADAQLSWWYTTSPSIGVISTDCVSPMPVEPGEEPPVGDGSAVSGSAGEPTTGGGEGSELPPEDAGTITPVDDCVYEEPTPPAGILTADQARARTLDLLTQIGVDPAAFQLDAYADEWYASVSALQRLGSVTSPVGWYFGFGADGLLEYAGGVLARPEEVGPYPLVDLDTALTRLRDGYYGGIIPLAADDAVSMGAPEVSCTEDSPCEDELPPAEPQHLPVTLAEARLDLWWAWESSGTVWLLPAFTFLADDGTQFTVPAVTDEYLIMDAVAVDPGVDEPAPPPVDGDEVPPAGVEPVVIGEDEAATLVGLTEDEALAAAAERGWDARVVARDGEGFAVTDDYSTGRVNLTIDAGVVVAVTVG